MSNFGGLERLDSVRNYMVKHNHGTEGLDYFRAVALNNLSRHDQALAVLSKIDEAKYEAAFHGADSRWKLQAERGRAMLGLGQLAEARALIRKAVDEMRSFGIDQAVLMHYTSMARSGKANGSSAK